MTYIMQFESVNLTASILIWLHALSDLFPSYKKNLATSFVDSTDEMLAASHHSLVSGTLSNFCLPRRLRGRHIFRDASQLWNNILTYEIVFFVLSLYLSDVAAYFLTHTHQGPLVVFRLLTSRPVQREASEWSCYPETEDWQLVRLQPAPCRRYAVARPLAPQQVVNYPAKRVISSPQEGQHMFRLHVRTCKWLRTIPASRRNEKLTEMLIKLLISYSCRPDQCVEILMTFISI